MLIHLNRLLLGSLLLLAASSCKRESYSTNENGLKYRIIRKEDKKQIQLNDIVQLNLTYSDMRDSVLYDSRVIGDSFILKVSTPSFVGGFEEGLLLLGEGDSAEFLLSADSVFQKQFQQPRPPYIALGAMLKFKVGIRKVMSEKEFSEKIRREYAEQQQDQIRAIEGYLVQNSITAQPSSPGVYFIILKEGSGRIPVYGDSVELKYSGKTLNGRIFDSSNKAGKNLTYKIGSGGYLEAWERAITTMKTGTLARLILTSDNAFRKSTKAPVPPDTPVVFDIELLRIY